MFNASTDSHLCIEINSLRESISIQYLGERPGCCCTYHSIADLILLNIRIIRTPLTGRHRVGLTHIDATCFPHTRVAYTLSDGQPGPGALMGAPVLLVRSARPRRFGSERTPMPGGNTAAGRDRMLKQEGEYGWVWSWSPLSTVHRDRTLWQCSTPQQRSDDGDDYRDKRQ
jgi:hypothetical protein